MLWNESDSDADGEGGAAIGYECEYAGGEVHGARGRCGAPTDDSPRRQPWDRIHERGRAPDGAKEENSR